MLQDVEENLIRNVVGMNREVHGNNQMKIICNYEVNFREFLARIYKKN